MTRSPFGRSAVTLVATATLLSAATLLIAGVLHRSDEDSGRTLSTEEAAYIFGGQTANRQCGAVEECQSTSACTVSDEPQCKGKVQTVRDAEAIGKACNRTEPDYVCTETLPNEDCSTKFACEWDIQIELCIATLPAAGYGRAPKNCSHALVP